MSEESRKTLYMLRHAKAQKAEPGQDDSSRALIRRGREAATRMGAWLAKREPLPTHILCSPAIRTRQTLELILPGLGNPVIDYDPRLYMASDQVLLDAIARLPREADAAMIVGHNPAIEQLALDLAGHAPAQMIDTMRAKYPTCALTVAVAGTRDWSRFATSSKAEVFIRPIDLE
jgi:phosphohistidine phosphatase